MTITEALAAVLSPDEDPSHIFRVPVDYGSPGGYRLTLTFEGDSPIGVYLDMGDVRHQLVGLYTWPSADAQAVVVDEALAQRAGFCNDDRGEDAILAFAQAAISAWDELYKLAVPIEELVRRDAT